MFEWTWSPISTGRPVSSRPIDRSDGDALLRNAVSRLPAGEREAVSLVSDGLTYRQVAQQLGLADGKVKAVVRRALTRLAQTVGPDAANTG